jgi:hypothetical protein
LAIIAQRRADRHLLLHARSRGPRYHRRCAERSRSGITAGDDGAIYKAGAAMLDRSLTTTTRAGNRIQIYSFFLIGR